MEIINSYHKKLNFQVADKSVGIEPNEVITVEEEIGQILIQNPWIMEAKGKAPVFERCGCPLGKVVAKSDKIATTEKTKNRKGRRKITN